MKSARDTNPSTPGAALRHLRSRAGISMGDLARFLGCSVLEVSNIESGCIDPLSDDPPTQDSVSFEGVHKVHRRWACDRKSGRVLTASLAGDLDRDATFHASHVSQNHGEGYCSKAEHVDDSPGYLHAADDDGPYDVDGVLSCGRCHRFMPGIQA